jgi:hypothetical protein
MIMLKLVTGTNVPVLTWTVCESVNNTIGLPPDMMLYGRLPMNRLTLIKHAWEGQCNLPPNLGHNTYRKHAEYYNRWSKDKSFECGDKVVVLCADSTSKIRSRWQTGTVLEVRFPSIYMVEMPNGA